jgi:hypothetical protein
MDLLCRVIDSHPYENVGDDGRPLAGRESAENVIPDYETIFVKVFDCFFPCLVTVFRTVCFWASRIRIRNYLYGYGSFRQQAKK